MSEPIWKGFKGRRIVRRNAGVFLIVLGLLLLVSIRFRMKIPAFLWIQLIGGGAALAIGWLLFATAYQAPYREILALAAERRAAITPSDLVVEMDLELENARTLLQKMEREGLLSKAENVEAYIVSHQAPKRIDK